MLDQKLICGIQEKLRQRQIYLINGEVNRVIIRQGMMSVACSVFLLVGCSTYSRIPANEAGAARFSVSQINYEKTIKRLILKNPYLLLYRKKKFSISRPQEVCQKNKDGDVRCYFTGSARVNGVMPAGNYDYLGLRYSYKIDSDYSVSIKEKK